MRYLVLFSWKPSVPVVVLLMAALLSASSCLAAGPNESTCADLGYLTVKCYDCSSGSLIKKGIVAMLAEYEAKHKTCVTDAAMKLAKNECLRTYGIQQKYYATRVDYLLNWINHHTEWKSPACQNFQ